MVQYFKGGPSRSALWAEMLGPAAGKGLGNMLGTYQTNKALEGVLNDPAYKDKSQSERMSALQTTLSRYGERGQKVLQQRLMVEQQQNQESITKAENKFLSGKELSEKELELVRPEMRIQAMKAQAPKGGVTAQPIPKEYSQKIPEILNANKDVSAEELASAFDAEGIPSTYTNKYIETRRRDQERTSGETIKIHEMTKEEDKEIYEKASTAKKQIESIKDIREVADKVKPSNISNWFKGFGKVGDKLADAFTTAAQGKFAAALPTLIEGWKDVFGVRLSDADLKIIQDKLPGLGKDAAANKAILDVIEKYAKPNLMRAEIANEIKKENKGFRPIDFTAQVEERLQKRLTPVPMITPDGRAINVPPEEVEEAEKLGATRRGGK